MESHWARSTCRSSFRGHTTSDCDLNGRCSSLSSSSPFMSSSSFTDRTHTTSGCLPHSQCVRTRSTSGSRRRCSERLKQAFHLGDRAPADRAAMPSTAENRKCTSTGSSSSLPYFVFSSASSALSSSSLAAPSSSASCLSWARSSSLPSSLPRGFHSPSFRASSASSSADSSSATMGLSSREAFHREDTAACGSGVASRLSPGRRADRSPRFSSCVHRPSSLFSRVRRFALWLSSALRVPKTARVVPWVLGERVVRFPFRLCLLAFLFLHLFDSARASSLGVSNSSFHCPWAFLPCLSNHKHGLRDSMYALRRSEQMSPGPRFVRLNPSSAYAHFWPGARWFSQPSTCFSRPSSSTVSLCPSPPSRVSSVLGEQTDPLSLRAGLRLLPASALLCAASSPSPPLFSFALSRLPSSRVFSASTSSAPLSPSSSPSAEKGEIKGKFFKVTLKALAGIEELKRKRREATGTGRPFVIRLGVRSGGCSGLSYVLDIVDEASVTVADHREDFEEADGFSIVVDPQSLLYVIGTKLDYSDDLIGGGFRVINPNASRSCGCGMSFGVSKTFAQQGGIDSKPKSCSTDRK
ncbi:HesB-like domain-containing protein [Toxoplasma gondii RUB]|uniref:HesB-like domain-containing protein n=1 Tax=Toxoplasma gondii RUB TaxID=935652 RepID=A0A086LXG8_TOXGO|nr:HesB-like domain-containing protein [Toxoplasma gondii RUB]